MNRRGFLKGTAAGVLAPFVITTPGLLMPVRKLWTPRWRSHTATARWYEKGQTGWTMHVAEGHIVEGGDGLIQWDSPLPINLLCEMEVRLKRSDCPELWTGSTMVWKYDRDNYV